MSIRCPKTVAVLAMALILALAGLAWLSASRLVSEIGGDYAFAPEDAGWVLSERAKALIERAYADVDEDAVIVDHNVHLLSFGQRSGPEFDNRSFVNPAWLSPWNPVKRLRTAVWLDASGIDVRERADDQYLARVLRQAGALPRHHRLLLSALDQRYDAEGRPQPEQTVYAVDNAYVWAVAQAHPERIQPVVSVHPYRTNAVDELARWAERGVEAVTWHPLLQNIDPADDRIESYFRALAEHGLTLYTHTGAASGLGVGNPAFGDPMRYRAALAAGVDVVMIHCGATGHYPDPDGDGRVPGIELFLRLMRNPDYAGQLRGALVGVTVEERTRGALTRLLQHPQIADRLVYGSGYPLPAVDAAIDTGELVDKGFITRDQAAALEEIYAVNPLLFDFVLKRTMRLPHTDLGLPANVFTGPTEQP